MDAFAVLLEQAEQEYRRLTPGSERLFAGAQDAMPGGDTRNSVYFRPYPLFLDEGQGAHVADVDGNRYLDCSNNWTSLILGHAHPAVVEAVTRQVARGSAFAAANPHASALARIIKERVPSIDKLRFANSGTEATMLAVRAARAFTGRPLIVKMAGAYHGSHDDFEVAGGRVPAGIPADRASHVVEVEYNDKDDLTRTLAERGDETAAVIVEGIMGAAGMIPPADGYLRHVREETERRGILLIIDEVISLRLALGGAQELYGVRPDLTALGKIIGGGFPVGAVGGREEIMQRYSPLSPDYLHHSGTFNANPVTMVAGIATMRELDADTIGYINRLGERFAAGVARIARAQDIPLQVTGAGSLRNLHFAVRPPRHPGAVPAASRDLLRLLHLALLPRGVLAAPRGMFAISTPMTEHDVDGLLDALGGALRWMRPAIAERIGALPA